MAQETPLCFGPFRLDPVTERLWQNEDEILLGSKALAVLRYLVEHPGRVVTKAELLKEVWAGIYVTNTVLKVHMHAIRRALGETVEAPRYIETIPRQGYRFVAGRSDKERDTETLRPGMRRIVGREQEVEQLRGWLEQALEGERRVVFVTGEPGIGKTTVVELLLSSIEQAGRIRVGRGQCLEQYGKGEAYLPVLEAFGQLYREPSGDQVLDVLRQYAPTWLVQMPGLVTDAELEVLQQRVHGTTRERMLREMAEAIDALAREQPLVLVFEDLHWSDRSTLELLAYLAQRRQHARLLIIGTYRPADVVASDHPLKSLKQELYARSYCDELPLELLTEDDISAYLAARLGIAVLPIELGTALHQQTEGNPLFMVNVVEYCLQQEALHEVNGQWELQRGEDFGVPESLRQLIAKQTERLQEDEQRVLEMASVAGTEFAAASVAAGLNRPTDEVEEACEALAWRGHFLQETGLAEWPDGTVSGRYAFRHALYQNVLYERLAPARRVRFHRTIGEREEAGYGDQARTIAAALALHFERGREYQKAVQYLQQAAGNAIRRSAPHEAIGYLTKGLELLKTQPETAVRMKQEFRLQITLGQQLFATKGLGAPAAKQAFARARELGESLGNIQQVVLALLGLSGALLPQGELRTARELADQALEAAEQGGSAPLRVWAHYTQGVTRYYMGDLTTAQDHLVQAITLYDEQNPMAVPMDPCIMALSYAAYTAWYCGFADEARMYGQKTLRLAERVRRPYDLALAQGFISVLYVCLREPTAALACAEAAIRLGTEHRFPSTVAGGTLCRGWVLAAQGQPNEGITELRRAIDLFHSTGHRIGDEIRFDLLAEAYGLAGFIDEGLAALVEARQAVPNEEVDQARTLRLRGELLLRQDNTVEAEANFRAAIAVARRQGAKSLELQATMSLCRLWQRQRKKKAARQLLAAIYGWFTEGFDTLDLQDAKALLKALQS